MLVRTYATGHHLFAGTLPLPCCLWACYNSQRAKQITRMALHCHMPEFRWMHLKATVALEAQPLGPNIPHCHNAPTAPQQLTPVPACCSKHHHTPYPITHLQ
jgi:hypothetical protein